MMKQNKLWFGICLAVFIFLLAACNAGERIAEEAIDQIAGEGAAATSEAFTGAVATEVVALATQEAGGDVAPSAVEERADENDVEGGEAAESGQNDANSGQDAGMGDDPLMITAGSDYPGLITGVQNGGDIFDVYQFETEPGQIVRVLFISAAENTADLSIDLSNGDGYDTSEFVSTGSTVELVMGSTNPNRYMLHVSHDGLADELNYMFDLVFESENDAASAADAGNDVVSGLPIQTGILIQGASLGDETGSNDLDCYTFNQPSDDGGMTINLAAPADQPFESFARGELYNGVGELITSGTAEYGNSYPLEFGMADYESAPAGDYTLCVESYSLYPYGVYEFMVTLK